MSRLIGDAPFSDGERALLLSEALSLRGLLWRHQARTTKAADCIGFLWLAMRRVRYIPKPRTDYGRTPSARKLRTELIAYLGEPVEDMRVGDIVTMAWAGDEQHVGLIVPHPAYGLGLLHADNNAPGPGGPRVVEHGIDKHWANRIIEGWRP